MAPWTKIIEQRIKEHEAGRNLNPVHIAELKKCVNAIKDACVTASDFCVDLSDQKRRGALMRAIRIAVKKHRREHFEVE